MLNYIKRNYLLNDKISTNDTYHTVYYIEFDSGHFYIGKHSTTNIYDSYFASGVLPLSMVRQGYNYTRSIISFHDTSMDAINKETELLSDKKIYNNPMCLNCYPGSPPDLSGTIVVSRRNKFKMINPKLLDIYLDDGWERKGVKRVFISKENDVKYVLQEEIDNYLTLGWTVGNVKARNRVFLYKNGKRIFIKKSCVADYIANGWVEQHNISGTKVYKKDNHIVKLRPHEITEYIKKGYAPSSTVDGLIYIVKGKQYKRVPEENLQEFLSSGWKRGNNTTGSIYINDGSTEKRINVDDRELYPMWVDGRLPKTYLNNSVTEKRIYSHKTEEIKKFLDMGYELGKLQRQPKIQIYKEKKIKRINPTELANWKQYGWTDIFDPTIHFHPRLKNHSMS